MKKQFNGEQSETRALEMLRELASHISYDAGVNGSLFTNKPYGRVSSNEEKSFWIQNVESLPKDASGPLVKLVREVDTAIRASEKTPNGDGVLYLEKGRDSLWQRIQSNFETPPDVITDVVAPAIRDALAPKKG
jgi:hypothetical protein